MMHKTVFPSGKPIPANANIFELDECFPTEHGGLNLVPGLYKNVMILHIFSGRNDFRKFNFVRDHINNMLFAPDAAGFTKFI